MKNYYETIKDTTARLGENTLQVPKGTELVLVKGAFGGKEDGYAVKNPLPWGADPHDSIYRYAYVENAHVFVAIHARAPKAIKSDNWQETCNEWLIKIAGQEFEFFTGSGIDKAPNYDSVMHCLISDSRALEQDFEEWAEEFDYDTDSRKAYALWEACCANARKLLKTGIDINAERERLQDY